MPTYEVDVGGKTYEVDAPDPNTAWQWASYTHSQKPAPVKQAPFSLKDTALSAAQSAVGATKSIAESFGAGNAPAEYLEGVQKDLGKNLSPERQAELQQRARLEKEAAKSGKTLDEISAGLGGVKEAPIQTIAQGVGSSLPTVALGIGAGALGATFGAPVAIAAGVGMGVKYLIGALQGAGEVKGSVYDAVRDGLIAKGMPEAQAKERARESQNYIGENWGTIAAGAGLGGVAGGTGLESELLGKFSKPVAAKIAAQAGKKAETNMLGAGLKEALPEGAQGGQEQYAQNKALQRAGIDTPTWSGVAGAAARDAAMGALTGSAVHPFTGQAPEAQTPTQPTDENGQLPLFGPDQLKGLEKHAQDLQPPEMVSPWQQEKTGEQLDLGLEATRNYGDMVKELERLKRADKTPEIEARIDDLKQQLSDRDTYEIDRIRGDKVQAAEDAKRADQFPGLAKDAPIIPRGQRDMFGEEELHVPEEPTKDLFGAPVRPGQEPAVAKTTEPKQLPLGLRRNPEGQPTALKQPEPTISAEDVMLTAIPLPKPVQQWVEKNVTGRTLSQVRAMVKAEPTLVEGKDPRAQLLQTLLATEVPAFKEAPNAKTAEAPAIKPTAQPRGSKPSVAVSGEPTRAGAVAPRPAAVAPTAGAPAKPVGLGLVPSEQPVGKGDNAPVAQPSALTTPPAKPAVATETAEEASQRKADAEAMRKAMAEQDKTYAKGPVLRPSKAAAKPTTPVQKVAEKSAASADEEAAARATEKVSKLKSPFDILDEYKENKRRNSKNVLPGQTLSELQSELAADKTAAGRALVRLMKSGKVKLADKSAIKGVGGEFDGKTVTLFADGIPKGHAVAVALHEVGAHMGMKNMLGEAAYQKVADRIIEMAKSKEASPERSLAQRALNRIPEADAVRGKEVVDDEAIAYFVEELAKAEASGELPKTGPLRAFWNQIRAALVASINRTFGTTFGMGDLTPEQIGAFASAAMTRESKTGINTQAEAKKNFSVSYDAEQLIDSMGPLDVQQKSALKRLIEGFQAQGDVDTITKARTQVADVAATVESRLSKDFNGAVRNSLGKLNPMGLFRQAQDYSKLLLEYFQTGTLVKDKDTGLYRSEAGKELNAPAKVYDALTKWGTKNGYSFERANNLASRILEAVRLDAMRDSNKTQGTDFVIHKLDPKSTKTADEQIDLLVAEYKADKDLQNLSDLMDKPRIALVDHMIKVGRLTPDEGAKWKEVVGYVPFDRIEDFAEKFNKIKKISGKGIAQVGKLPELVGSFNRPVGNVFDNYINTLGWMVGQVTKTDATINTLRSLEDLGQAKFLGNTPQGKDNTVGAYVGGELQYFQLPTKYDVMAFKDLNPPKAKWLQGLGAFSNILRTTVTAMPPFALKQVTDDVQRAIMTSGVKSPTALIRMSLTNFPKLALAELRGIQHPYVKEFGALGLTGEFDFQQGKPAVSLLADLGYKPRGKVKELLHRLEGITRASDLAVRKAIYDQTVKETGDALLAQTRAREFINFRRRGASDFVGAMVTTIPFFNAYIQGMDVLYRAASGADSSSSVNRAEARKMFWNRAATVLALSTLYAMGKSDDDDYNEMDLRTRDGNWVLGDGIKLPVPTELGALFKVIPERAVEYMRRQGTPEEQEAFEAVRTAAAYIFEQYVGRTVPIPQAAKPLLEAWTNHSFLTGRELEGIHQKGMVPSMRTASNTSELAIQIAKFAADQVGVEVSPIMIDNALRGYLGSTAATATLFTDGLLNPTRMDRPVHKWALVSNYAYDPVGSRRTSEFYDTREKVGQLNNTLNDLAKTDIDAAEKFAVEHQQELALNSAVHSTLNQIEQTRAYRKYLDSKEAAAEMTQQERQDALVETRKYEAELVGWLREAKTQLRTQ